MCGIVGVVKKGDSEKLVKEALAVLRNRGRDGFGIYKGENACLGHTLHSVVGHVRQPIIEEDNVFVCNCEIYNWKKLDKKYKFNARNDAEALFRLLKKKGVNDETLKELDGVYAFALLSKDKIYLARDMIGLKPLWYSHANGFYFASEKKVLEKIDVIDANEINPRKIFAYDINKDKLKIIQREFFSAGNDTKAGLKEIEKKTEELLKEAIKKRIPDRKFGILFSGGIDSTMIALILKKMKIEFTCYTAVIDDPQMHEAEDLIYAKRIAEYLKLDHKIIKIKPEEIENYLRTVVPLIEDTNVVKVEVALTFYAACKQAKKDECKVILTGLGSEEIFAGYQRHKESTNINKECISGLLKLYERDLYRDDVITMYNNLEVRLPFLDKKLVEFALKIPAEFKLKDGIEKFILRKIAKNLGLSKEFAERKKRAAQYGSKVNRSLSKLTKKSGFKYKSEYLKQFYPTHNLKLGALISSGKDSIYAMHIMIRQNYSVECLISMKSRNKDSYMFHTPTIEIVEMQSESLGIPLMTGKTKGNKEKELRDLENTIKKAKKIYRLDGIITGALFSTYQRDRIERICDNLGLKIFSPLWHINQETEVREIIDSGFKFIITKVAAEGLDKGWLNKVITEKELNKLILLNKKIGFNIAGEGGEYETLMIDGPIFKKKIEIIEHEIVEESKNTAHMFIKKALLKDK